MIYHPPFSFINIGQRGRNAYNMKHLCIDNVICVKDQPREAFVIQMDK